MGGGGHLPESGEEGCITWSALGTLRTGAVARRPAKLHRSVCPVMLAAVTKTQTAPSVDRVIVVVSRVVDIDTDIDLYTVGRGSSSAGTIQSVAP